MLRVLAVLAVAGFLISSPLHAQNYLREMPTVADVQQKFMTGNQLDTLALQVAVLNVFFEIGMVQNGRVDAMSRPADLPAAERRLYEGYQARITEIFATPGIDRNALNDRALQFGADPATRSQVLALFSQQWRDDFAAAARRFDLSQVTGGGGAASGGPTPGGGFLDTTFDYDGESITLGQIIVNWIKQLAWLAVLGVFVVYLLRRRRTSTSTRSGFEKDSREELARLGGSVEERTKRIDQLFNQRSEALNMRIHGTMGFRTIIKADIVRSIAAMPAREREALRAVYQLYNIGCIDAKRFYYARFVLAYGDGAAQSFNTHWEPPATDFAGALKSYTGWTTEGTVSLALQWVDDATRTHAKHPVVKALKEKLLGGGEASMSSAEAFADAQGNDRRPRMVLGLAENTGAPVTYAGEGSIMTIAPPRSGKTQCHVLPTLLTWMGPAVVLDIKGEIHDATAKWRSENVGPVYRFSPLDPANSHRYNPLAAVRSEADFLWEDSRFLADMMIVPTNAKDPFWETRARDVLTAAIARACLKGDPAQRTLGSVLDVFHGIGWDDFTNELKACGTIRSVSRAGHSLAEMDRKTRDGVLQTGLASLSAWDGDRIERTTRSSDWNPLDLRSGENPTIYICLKSNEVKSYVSILRVLISQHIRGLTASLPPRGSPPILFMLDELPQLKHMPPVEEGLNVGSQYGVRLWMFAQSIGQMKEAYENAEGMIGACAVQTYMNPSLFDGTAQKLSDDIGMQEGVLDAQRQKIVEAAVLAGPEYKDYVIVMASGFKPFRVRKGFAYEDPKLRERIGGA